MPAPAIRQPTPTERRAIAREQVRDAARAGKTPADEFKPDDLAWAFRGSEDELEQLGREAERVRNERRERDAHLAQRKALRLETEKAVKELQAEEERELRERAEKIARKRLGL